MSKIRYTHETKISKLRPWKPESSEVFAHEGFGEGRGEKSILVEKGIERESLGTKSKEDLTPDEVGSDFLGGEVKCVQTKKGAIINSFRTGGSGEMMLLYHDVLILVRDWQKQAEMFSDRQKVPLEFLVALNKGQVKFDEEHMKLIPAILLEEIRERWSVKNILSYALLYLTASFGYAEVLQRDFEEVFTVVSTSQCRFNIGINWNKMPDVDTMSNDNEENADHVVWMRSDSGDRGDASHSVSETVCSQRCLGDSERAHQSGGDGGGVCAEGNDGGNWSQSSPNDATHSSDSNVQERTEDSCCVLIELAEWRSKAG